MHSGSSNQFTSMQPPMVPVNPAFRQPHAHASQHHPHSHNSHQNQTGNHHHNNSKNSSPKNSRNSKNSHGSGSKNSSLKNRDSPNTSSNENNSDSNNYEPLPTGNSASSSSNPSLTTGLQKKTNLANPVKQKLDGSSSSVMSTVSKKPVYQPYWTGSKKITKVNLRKNINKNFDFHPKQHRDNSRFIYTDYMKSETGQKLQALVKKFRQKEKLLKQLTGSRKAAIAANAANSSSGKKSHKSR